jgi:CBS domain-containing protein
MSRDYVTVCDNLRLAELAPLFTQRGVGGAPVVDKDGALVGFISRADLSPVGSPSGIVQSAMTPFAFSIDEDTPVSRAAALLAYEGVHRLPVLSFRGALIGMITDAMILRWLARMAGYKLPND